MPNDLETLTPSAPHPLFGELSRNWGWLLAFGVLSIILGTIGLGMTFGLTLASVLFFGVLLVVGGTFQLVEAFKCRGWKGILWHALIALLYVAAGLLIAVNPVLASATLTLALAGVLIAVGLTRVILAIQHRAQTGWVWLLLAGLISIALGAMIIAKWPASGLWVIGLFVAIELIFNGWSYLFVALAARRAGKLEREDTSGIAA
ncbi:MAG: HdeD family acid-resistance protein [Thiocapsa sp.]|jgi:uncharacterized membrane protein HdeD (DUF308 family)|nr:HdeD family acid-resistance protein [Thiocapsa sp.]MCG6896987.1 HdeD family acid-resistance protein [Thiocapsa sp.]MCG6986426.1 HdeD family acid-resistance protein [Thiocapsa sp.]